MADLLFEIGVEEIPAGYIPPALAQLERGLAAALDEAGLSHGPLRTAGAPRRLVVSARDVAQRQADRDEEILGPPVRAAYDAQGKPTKAAEGFARVQGVSPADIQRVPTPRGEYCLIRRRRPGRPTPDILAEALPQIMLRLAFPKSMLWPGGERPFARPVRWIVALFGRDVIPFSVCGIASGRDTEAHLILDRGARLPLESADFEAYRELLRRHHVIVDAAERRDIIRQGLLQALRPFGGPFHEETLLDEVTYLVQYPSVSVGAFDDAFLDIPDTIIETAMMEHQRYFPVRDGAGRLCARFLVVSDRGPQPSDRIRIGNEQVLRARLADARFFYDLDRKTPLAARIDELAGVQFLTGLGAYRDKVRRLERLTDAVARALGETADTAAHARRAAFLCKSDLLTAVVGEFPKLQGRMGAIYARNDGEPEAVAQAIIEHYMPRSAEDGLPASPAGRVLSLAEKLDNMTSCFALGLVPTGSADPYALRRQSQAVLRMIAEHGAHFDLEALLRSALQLLPAPHAAAQEAIPRLLDFLKDRLVQLALDQGAPHDLIEAVLAPGWTDIADFHKRLAVVRRLSAEPIWPRLVSAVERTHNISRDLPEDRPPVARLYVEPLEKRLGELYETHRGAIEQLTADRNYAEAGRRFAEVFADTLHEFFSTVYVNVEDAAVRENRLALLRAINRLYAARIADLSQIVTGVPK